MGSSKRINTRPAAPVRHVTAVPPPTAIPEGTSDHIAHGIRRSKLEREQARALEAVAAELGLTTQQLKRLRQREASRYTAHAKRRARLAEGERFTRQEIIRRDHATCYLCNQGPLDPTDIHIDHDIPLSRGGTHTADNVHVACTNCNLRKGKMTSSEYRATLRTRAR